MTQHNVTQHNDLKPNYYQHIDTANDTQHNNINIAIP
jgi:hypothetical protein